MTLEVKTTGKYDESYFEVHANEKDLDRDKRNANGWVQNIIGRFRESILDKQGLSFAFIQDELVKDGSVIKHMYFPTVYSPSGLDKEQLNFLINKATHGAAIIADKHGDDYGTGQAYVLKTNNYWPEFADEKTMVETWSLIRKDALDKFHADFVGKRDNELKNDGSLEKRLSNIKNIDKIMDKSDAQVNSIDKLSPAQMLYEGISKKVAEWKIEV